MLSLVLPKGSLERATIDLFEQADLEVRRGSDRDYHASIDDPRIDTVRFLRPQEIPTYVEQGLFDLGITGRDWITETDSDVVSLGELEYSKATSNPVRIVLAVVKDHVADRGDQLPDGVRVSTEFPALTKRYFEKIGVKAKIVPSYGATEAKVPDIVDAIVDLTETGTSLKKHGLKIIDTLLTSRTELVTNAAAFADPAKRAAMEDIVLLLQGAIRARGRGADQAERRRLRAAGRARRAAGDGITDSHRARIGRHARRRVGGGEEGRQHADPDAEGGRRPRHPGDPHLQDRRVAVPVSCRSTVTRPTRSCRRFREPA